ncbi:MAG: inositol monophosphatase, partial [Bdellovibrionales bacterium]|nr:inositol monophosphatase [Bdellovibrionales bacterium]
MNRDEHDLAKAALEVAKRAALRAGAHAKRLREERKFNVSFKGNRDLVTEADVQCEEMILQEIRSNFPDHNILSEEAKSDSVADLSSGPLWIVDPIDGTTNYAHGHVHVGVSIGFAINGIRSAAVVHCPFLAETYTAIRGEGAQCNGEHIQVSNVTSLAHSLICTGFPYQRENLEGLFSRFHNVIRVCRDMRRLGAASVDLC